MGTIRQKVKELWGCREAVILLHWQVCLESHLDHSIIAISNLTQRERGFVSPFCGGQVSKNNYFFLPK
jgi:hypothetical protein